MQDDIIEKVPIGIPTPWCSSLHVVLKKDGQVRITIDPRDLNKALMREYHPTNTVEQVAQRCGNAKYLTVLDTNQGYFQIALDKTSRNYTAFNTPFGRYRYKRLPMGITCSPEIFQRVFGDIFAPINGLEIIMDDCLIVADTLEEHNRILKETLQTCRDYNITLSIKKTQLCTESVHYSGHKFTHKGLELDKERINAIIGMPEPKCIADVSTLLGMVTYVGKFLKDLSSITQPLRDLIKEANQRGFKWHFDPIHKETFEKIKKLMCTAPVLKFYSLHDPVVISCDASQSGLGCVLFQRDAPVAYGSRALTETECAYAQIEKELLAIVFAVKKFHSYIYGRTDVIVETDHRPLVRILEKPLYQVPLRLQKMRMKLQGYQFSIVARRGTEIPVADALSRAYLSGNNQKSKIFTVSTQEIVNVTQVSPRRLQEIKEKTVADKELQTVINTIAQEWPHIKSQVDYLARPYFDQRHDLNIIDGILYKGQRIVIPVILRKSALNMLHTAHQGIVKTKQLARDLLYWPGINNQIEDIVSNCSSCQERRSTQIKEPLLPTPIPQSPWQHVAQDLFDCLDHKWLICVDYYSEYFEIERMDNGTQAHNIIQQSKKWFSTHGIPEQVTSDNGPPWNGQEWKNFATTYNFTHTPISPKHSQANGMVEKAVGIAKKMLLKCYETKTDPYLALINIRNTPGNNTIGSPAQRLFSRRTQTLIPTCMTKLQPEIQTPSHVSEALREERHVKAKEYYDRHKRPLKPLQKNDTIRVKVDKTWQPALLLSPSDNSDQPRSYNIKLPSGRVTRRNRRHLLKTREKDIYRNQDDYDLQTPYLNEPNSVQRQNEELVCKQNKVESDICNKPRLIPSILKPAQKEIEITKSGRVSKPPAKLAEFVRYCSNNRSFVN